MLAAATTRGEAACRRRGVLAGAPSTPSNPSPHPHANTLTHPHHAEGEEQLEVLLRYRHPRCQIRRGVNARKGSGATPLLAAVAVGSEANVTALLVAGADPALAHARTGTTPLGLAASKGFPRGVILLLAGDAPADAPDSMGHLPLHLAAAGATPAHAACVRMLLEGGAAVDARTANAAGWTALHFAAGSGSCEAASLLAEAGADPAARTADSGQTPAELAAARGHAAVSHLLRRLEAAGPAAASVAAAGKPQAVQGTPVDYARGQPMGARAGRPAYIVPMPP